MITRARLAFWAVVGLAMWLVLALVVFWAAVR
jgi:hypothetical protein